MGFNLPLLILRRRLLGSAAFTPATLFSFGEQGVWFDPSDVANLDWRRNLLTWTEQFDNAGWTKSQCSISANVDTAPDGSATADRLTSAGSFPALSQGVSASGNVTFTVYAKDDGSGQIVFRLTGSDVGGSGQTQTVYRFTFSTQIFTFISGGTATGSSQAVGNGWYRITLTCGTTTLSGAFLYPRWSDATVVSVLVWGAQLELGSVATTYQPITDVNAEARALFPNATLYQDVAGTTLVTTPGQPVGLMLDKSRGLALGPELVTNGDFSVGTTGWSASGSASLSVVSGALRVANGAAVTGGASQTFNTVAGTTYRWTYYVDPATSGGAVVRVRDGGTLTVISTATRTVAGAYTLLFVATGSTTQINCVNSSSTAGVYHDVDNISIKELAGNHAVQATGANRPNYGIEPQGGRRNLLTGVTSNPVDTSGLTLFGDAAATLAVVSDAAAIAAAGLSASATGGTVFRLNNTAGTTPAYARFNAAITMGTDTWTLSAFVRGSGTTGLDVNAGTWSGSTSQALTAGYQRAASTGQTNTSSNSWRIRATAGTDLYFVLMQAEVGSTATAYQSALTQYNVTEAGVPPVSYLFFNGNNFSMSTPSINFPAGPTNQTLGPELVTNGTFVTDTTGWTAASSTLSVVGGALRVTVVTNGISAGARTQISTVVGRTYRLTLTFVADASTGNSFVSVGTTAGGSEYLNANLGSIVGEYMFVFTATATTSFIAVSTSTAALAGETNDWDNISVREIDAAYAPDKMTVWAGVRKLSDAAQGIFTELSADTSSNNGTFRMTFPAGNGSSNYGWLAKGTVQNSLAASGFASPVTSVITASADISGDSITLRPNGVTVGSSGSDLGTGTFRNYPLFIGARNNASIFFNGHLYSLIVRGAQSTTAQITETETWVAGETGFFVPAISGVPTVGIS